MSITVAGIVKNGVVVPNAPLPEGARVEVHLNDASTTSQLRAQVKQPRSSLADWAEAHAEHWGNQLNSGAVDSFTGRRF